MKNNDRILILSDLDGTYLDDSSKAVKRNTDAAKEWVARGGMFSFLSGRRAAEIPDLIPECRELANVPAVVLNGTALYDYSSNSIIELNTFDATEVRKDIERIQKKYAEVGIDTYIAYDELEMSNDVNDTPSDNWCQVMMGGNPEAIDTEIDEIMNKYSDSLFVEYYKGDYFRIVSKKASKGNGINSIREYCRRLGFDVTVYAIGDHENDRSVVDSADIFTCPANAIDSIKASSKQIFCSNNEGCVADLIEYVIKNS